MKTKKSPDLFRKGTLIHRRHHFAVISVSERVYFSRLEAKNANLLTGSNGRVISEVM